VELAPALAVMLGANVARPWSVQVLSFEVAISRPVLVLAGVVLFGAAARRRTTSARADRPGTGADGAAPVPALLEPLVAQPGVADVLRHWAPTRRWWSRPRRC
jgi:phosphate:Na+ symporter